MSIMKNAAGNPIHSCRGYMCVAESALTVATSPVTVAVSTGLGGGTARGNRGYIANDGSSDMTVELALEGTNYLTAFTVKNGDTFDLTGFNISNIRLTRGAGDTNYRVVVW